MSQKRITSSTPILNHDVAEQLPLPPQLHGRGQVGLLTVPADIEGRGLETYSRLENEARLKSLDVEQLMVS